MLPPILSFRASPGPRGVRQYCTVQYAYVQALLAIDAIFGRELPQVELFNRQVTQAYLTLLAEGAKATVAKYAAKLK